GRTENTGTAADTFDVNGDGESNLLEFATGQSPLVTSRLETPVSLSGNEIEFRYSRSKAALADGVSFLVEWSDSLLVDSWSSLGVSKAVDSEDAELEHVVATLPMGDTERRFVRLVVEP
ncbi:hypothetical protein N9192_01945, partial [Akkermansiaceae bacterium]|nr:hypothetical protein [Akkermansiaceae bacterium]